MLQIALIWDFNHRLCSVVAMVVTDHLPRALSWAGCLLAFQTVFLIGSDDIVLRTAKSLVWSAFGLKIIRK